MGTRSKRLRKKLYLGEFAILGFELSCYLPLFCEQHTDDSQANYELMDPIFQLLEHRDLQVTCGGTDKSFNAFVCSSNRYVSVTDGDRDAINQWLESNGASNIVIGPLVDANYGV